MSYRAYTNSVNPHAFNGVAQSAELQALREAKPGWVDRGARRKYPGLEEPPSRAGFPDIGEHAAQPLTRTFKTFYGPIFEIDKYSTTFGCREWAYQLYDSERSYIDVTSYIPKSKDKGGPGTYIREFVGWARFGDKKPVIGRHEAQWYCLHDCPDGGEPGAIADIKVWSSNHGWAVPKPPTKAPVFPDPPMTRGTYPK